MAAGSQTTAKVTTSGQRRHELVVRDAGLITRIDRLTQGDVAVVLEPLEFVKLIHRYEHRRRLPVLRQHNTLMAAPGTIDQLGEMTAGR
jgi:hypothetical protein